LENSLKTRRKSGFKIMSTLDTEFVRSQFPAFGEPSLQGFGFFENAGGSYACGQVIETLENYYKRTKVQPYYNFFPSRLAGEEMDRAKRRMAAWLNVSPEEVHFGPSTSQNTYVLAQTLRQHLDPGDEIIVTNQDHEANIGVWRRLETEGFVIREWQVDPETAELTSAGLDSLLNDRTRVVALTHCSNIVGSMNPVREWVERIHAFNALAIVDGVSYCPHGLPDIRQLGADIYLFSLYKVYGPHLGVMVMDAALNQKLPTQGHFFNTNLAGARFTPAGPDHAQIAAANGVLDYFEQAYEHHFGQTIARDDEKSRELRGLFQHHERALLGPLLDLISTHPRTRLIGRKTTEDRAPTVSFKLSGQTPAELSSKLAAQQLGVGEGHFYAYRLIEALGVNTDDGVVRVSFVHYTTRNEVGRLLDALQQHL
jgi:cysteine desulfurase family protein (TIGR01976 family)